MRRTFWHVHCSVEVREPIDFECSLQLNMAHHHTFGSSRAESRGRVVVGAGDRELRQLLRTVLCHDGFDVIEVTDGPSLIEFIVSSRELGTLPDLVLADVFLPGMSGLDTLEWLRARGLQLPVVLISAEPESCADRAESLGAAALLEKPFELDDLRMIVLNLAPRRIPRPIPKASAGVPHG